MRSQHPRARFTTMSSMPFTGRGFRLGCDNEAAHDAARHSVRSAAAGSASAVSELDAVVVVDGSDAGTG